MARQVCIRVGDVLYCTGSKIRDCSCDRQDDFNDPYPETPEGVDDARRTLADVSNVFDIWSKSGDTSDRAAKFYAISAITRLILMPGVDLAGPFVIMSLQDGDESAAH